MIIPTIRKCFISERHPYKVLCTRGDKDIIENGWLKIHELSEVVPIDIILKCMYKQYVDLNTRYYEK